MGTRSKTHRLDRQLYTGRIICSFTACIQSRERLFISQEIFAQFETVLKKCLQKHNVAAHVYIFMPNHTHLLLEGQSEESDLWKCMVAFKQLTGYWLSKNRKERWQKDFFDHFIRSEDKTLVQTKYILENPVRARLVGDWEEYPFKGSTIYDFSTW